MHSFAEAVILTDVLGMVRSANPAAESLLGFGLCELEGKVIEETVPILDYQSINGPTLDRRAAIERYCKGIATLLTRNGSKVKVEISTSPILDKGTGSGQRRSRHPAPRRKPHLVFHRGPEIVPPVS